MYPAGHALGMLCILRVPPDAAAPGKQGLRIGGDCRYRHTFDVEVCRPAQQVLARLAAAHGGIVFGGAVAAGDMYRFAEVLPDAAAPPARRR